MAKVLVSPIPGVFIPGIPSIVHEFDSTAEAEKWLKGDEGGYARAGAFSLEAPSKPAAPAAASSGKVGS